MTTLFRRILQTFRRKSDPVFTVPGELHWPWQSEQYGELDPLKRMLVLVRPRQPYVHWINQRTGFPRPLAQARRSDSLAFLIPRVEGSFEEAEAFVSQYWPHFFAQMLEAWEQATETWPQDRTLTMFRHWFDIEIGDMVLDLGQYVNQDELEDAMYERD